MANHDDESPDPLDRVDLRIDAGWMVPIEPPGAFAAHSVLITRGEIVAFGPTAAIPESSFAVEHLQLPDHVVLPGLVNAHSHAAMNLFRGIADDTPLRTWLETRIWPLEASHVSPAFVYAGSLLAAAEMLSGGITCCNDMYFYPHDIARAFDTAGMRALIGAPILDFPTPYAGDAEGYLQRGLEAREQWLGHSRLTFSLAPHSPYTVSDAAFDKIMMFAQLLDLTVQTHLHETSGEIEQGLHLNGERPLQRLARLGVTGPRFVAIHAVHMDREDIAILAREHSHAVHCPSSNLKLASGIAPVAGLAEAGVNIAFGTDGAASNNRLDLFEEMRLGALLAKVQRGDAACLPAREVLRMGTLNGARALGLDAEIGSIALGKRADLIAVRLDTLESLPCYDPLSHLVYVSSRRDVTHVWVDGECLVRDGALQRLDRRELMLTARRWQEKLQ